MTAAIKGDFIPRGLGVAITVRCRRLRPQKALGDGSKMVEISNQQAPCFGPMYRRAFHFFQQRFEMDE